MKRKCLTNNCEGYLNEEIIEGILGKYQHCPICKINWGFNEKNGVKY